MITTNYTVKDIAEYTGLKDAYIRKFIYEAEKQIKPYIVTRGEKNTLYYNSNILIIFDKVKQLKEEGYVVTEIKRQLFENSKNEVKTSKNSQETDTLKEIKYIYSELLRSKDETIKTKDEQIKEVKEKLLLLTGGIDPERYREEQINREVEKRETLLKLDKLNQEFKTTQEKLSELNVTNQLKEKSLTKLDEEKNKLEKEKKETLEALKKKEESLQENERLIKDKEKVIQELKEKEDKRLALLKELESLEGKWFVGNKRKELLVQIKSLS